MRPTIHKGHPMSNTHDTIPATHTPGPWAITNEHCDNITVHADGLYVANIVTNRDCVDDDTANARLIAAAPELLEALRGMVDHAYHGVRAEHWRRVAIAALAKATGRG